MTLRVMLAAALLSPLAAPASAAGLLPPVADCNAHGTLTHSYSVAQLQAALASMPADVAEYTDCHDVIERQLLSLLSSDRGGGPGAGGGAFFPAPVLAVLIALGVAGVGFAGLALRQRLAS